jgi:nucleoporin NUP1
MVWDAERGFVRESDLRAENPGPVGANEAERILFALENRRNTPLQTARAAAVPFSQGGPLPAELVGASTRQIRKAINVPLATAQTRETLRSKREKELQEDRQRGVSVLISPYGRRRQAEEELRSARAAEKRQREREREEMERRRAEMEVDGECFCLFS